MNVFTAVFGCGPKTANKWIKEGATSIADVIKAENIWRKEDSKVVMGMYSYVVSLYFERKRFGTISTQENELWHVRSGLAFYEDLNTPVSKSEAEALRSFILEEVKSIEPETTVELCGGFRRYSCRNVLLAHCLLTAVRFIC